MLYHPTNTHTRTQTHEDHVIVRYVFLWQLRISEFVSECYDYICLCRTCVEHFITLILCCKPKTNPQCRASSILVESIICLQHLKRFDANAGALTTHY